MKTAGLPVSEAPGHFFRAARGLTDKEKKMDRFIKPLIAFVFLFATSSQFPAFGLHLATAATITLTLADSSADVGGSVGHDGAEVSNYDEGYTSASTTIMLDGNNWATGGRHSATYVSNSTNSSLAAITLYGTHEVVIEDGSWASGGGTIESHYEMTVTSDYGAIGAAATHILITKGDFPPDGGASFYIWGADPSNPVFEWNESKPDSGDVDTWITLAYGEIYHIDAVLDFGFWADGASDLVLDFTQSIQMWVEETPPVPIPGAVWLLGSGLIGLVAFGGRRKRPAC